MPSSSLVVLSSRLGLLGALGLVAVACIDAPRLEARADRAEEELPAIGPGAAARDPDPLHAGMVFVAGIAVDIPVASAPSNGQGDEGDDEDEDGKGKGKKDGGGPPPPPPPPPPPSGEPTTTHLEVAGFWIDVHEVTVDSFRACVVAGGCRAPSPGPGCTTEAGLASHPVSCVTIDQARAYCASQSKRLVRNDEWTTAAAGAGLRPYPWGTQLPSAERVNACGSECSASGMYAGSDGHPRTAPASTFPMGRTPDGVDDLAGNVAEWVEGGAAPTARGGSFQDSDLASVRSLAARVVDDAAANVGFRCAADR